MTKIESYIRKENEGTDSVDDQVDTAKAMYRENITPSGDSLKRKELRELFHEIGLELEFKLRTILDNLVEINVVEEWKPSGQDPIVIGEVSDEVILGRIDETIEEYRDALIEHIHEEDPSGEEDVSAVADGGATLRSVVADGLEVAPDMVEETLRVDDDDTINRLNKAVNAVKFSDDFEVKEDDYGEIQFIHLAYRYNLTEFAVEMIEEETEEVEG